MKFLLIATILLTSCSQFILTPEGCASYKKVDSKGQAYQTEVCPNGKYSVQWQQADGSIIKSVYHNETIRFYILTDKVWVQVKEPEEIPTEIPIAP